MKRLTLLVGSLLAMFEAGAAQDFACMQDCYRQGYDRTYCASMCNTGPGPRGGVAPGMMDQPGLPKNPAFDQMQQDSVPKQPLPSVTDHKCMKDCQKRGYNYMLCQKQCSYSLHGQ